MRRFAALVTVVSLCLGFVLSAHTSALTPPAAPSGYIRDDARVILDETEKRLEAKLADYEKATGNEIAVLTVKSLEGDSLEDFSYRVATAWGPGNKEVNNGVLLLVAIDDRKLRIEVGRGLEPKLTDLQSNLIITQKITPYFKAGDYTTGIENGLTNIISVIGGERLSNNSQADSPASMVDIIFGIAGAAFFFIFPLLAYIGAFLARSKSFWAGGVIGALPGVFFLGSSLLIGIAAVLLGAGLGFLIDYLLSKNYRQRKSAGEDTSWWGSGGGFWGSSGGSSGGGFSGGGFGGGGSSGSW